MKLDRSCITIPNHGPDVPVITMGNSILTLGVAPSLRLFCRGEMIPVDRFLTEAV